MPTGVDQSLWPLILGYVEISMPLGFLLVSSQLVELPLIELSIPTKLVIILVVCNAAGAQSQHLTSHICETFHWLIYKNTAQTEGLMGSGDLTHLQVLFAVLHKWGEPGQGGGSGSHGWSYLVRQDGQHWDLGAE